MDQVTVSESDLAKFKESDISVISLNYTASDGPYAFWVNSTSLQAIDDFAVPDRIPRLSPCPYKRIVTAIPVGVESSIFYLYHQINESTFAEHAFDHSAGSWIDSRSISITTG